MLRLSKFFITLPLLSLPLLGLAPKLHAEVVLSQMDALSLLAKSRAADSKCKILPASEADELGGYLARAEVAVAARNSVSEVQSTISVGRALGATAACSQATSSEVEATLSAARQAMASVQHPRSAEADIAEDNPVSRQTVRTARAPEEPRRSLADYGRHAFAYYVERRCEYLSRRDIRAFWTAIIREHRAALSAYGRSAVIGTVRRAEARANAMECGAEGRQLVRAEYTKIARN